MRDLVLLMVGLLAVLIPLANCLMNRSKDIAENIANDKGKQGS